MPNPIGPKKRYRRARLSLLPSHVSRAAPGPASPRRRPLRRSPESALRPRRLRSPSSTLNAPATTRPALLAIDSDCNASRSRSELTVSASDADAARLGPKCARKPLLGRRSTDCLKAQLYPHSTSWELTTDIGNDRSVGSERKAQHRLGNVLGPRNDTGPFRPGRVARSPQSIDLATAYAPSCSSSRGSSSTAGASIQPARTRASRIIASA